MPCPAAKGFWWRPDPSTPPPSREGVGGWVLDPSETALHPHPTLPLKGEGSIGLVLDRLDQPPFERGEHTAELVPALQDLPMLAEQGPHALLVA